MEKRSVTKITISTLCIFIIFLAIGMWLRIQPSRATIIPPLPRITPTKVPSSTPFPMPTGTATHSIPSPTATSKPLPSPTNTPGIQVKTPSPVVLPTSTSLPIRGTTPIPGATPVPGTTPIPGTTPVSGTPIPPPSPLLSVSPTALDHMNTQSQCKYDTHGGAPYIDCILTLRDMSSTQPVLWAASINQTDYTLTPNSGQLTPGQMVTIQFVALPIGCPGSYMITVNSNANMLHVPIICTQVNISPYGTILANDYCTEVISTSTYTCKFVLLADPNNTMPAKWGAAVTASGGAVSVVFSPPSGTLAIGASIQITMTIVDPRCPVDTVELGFFVPETPALPQESNTLIWDC